MSSHSKPSYLSDVLRAGARPFAAAPPTPPRRHIAALAPPSETHTPRVGLEEDEHTRAEAFTQTLADERATPPQPFQTHARESVPVATPLPAQSALSEAPSRAQEHRHAPRLDTSGDDVDAIAGEHPSEDTPSPVSIRRSAIEPAGERAAVPRFHEGASEESRQSPAPSLPDEPGLRAAQDERARVSVESTSERQLEDAPKREATPATEEVAASPVSPVKSPEPARTPRQSAEPHKSLEAHIAELRARMQTPREPRALDVNDNARAVAPAPSSPPAPRPVFAQPTLDAGDNSSTGTQTTPAVAAAHASAPQSTNAPPSSPRARAQSGEANARPSTGAARKAEAQTASEPQSVVRQSSEPRARASESRAEALTKDEQAPRLSINRLDIRIVEQPHAPTPPPPPQTPSTDTPRARASAGFEALDRHYLGRFYLG